MKIRNGFVSNSSYSSFCIYGTRLEVSLTDEEEKKDTEGDALDTKMENLRNTIDKHKILEYHEDWDNNCFYVGRSWSSIKDSETGRQFKTSVESALKELTGKEENCETIDEVIQC